MDTLLSDISCGFVGGEHAQALMTTNPFLHSGSATDPQASLLEAPDHTLTVPILFLQGLVLLLYWYSGHSSVDSYKSLS
ncbi:hypothetical protein SK128_028584 [Halocaridina rubra]|uniref:Uncharacterized protein n=1 Tax=Halocaridina rubra TaxID=373956 RepID=A0AAN8XAC6_HALRR